MNSVRMETNRMELALTTGLCPNSNLHGNNHSEHLICREVGGLFTDPISWDSRRPEKNRVINIDGRNAKGFDIRCSPIEEHQPHIQIGVDHLLTFGQNLSSDVAVEDVEVDLAEDPILMEKRLKGVSSSCQSFHPDRPIQGGRRWGFGLSRHGKRVQGSCEWVIVGMGEKEVSELSEPMESKYESTITSGN